MQRMKFDFHSSWEDECFNQKDIQCSETGV